MLVAKLKKILIALFPTVNLLPMIGCSNSVFNFLPVELCTRNYFFFVPAVLLSTFTLIFLHLCLISFLLFRCTIVWENIGALVPHLLYRRYSSQLAHVFNIMLILHIKKKPCICSFLVDRIYGFLLRDSARHALDVRIVKVCEKWTISSIQK